MQHNIGDLRRKFGCVFSQLNPHVEICVNVGVLGVIYERLRLGIKRRLAGGVQSVSCCVMVQTAQTVSAQLVSQRKYVAGLQCIRSRILQQIIITTNAPVHIRLKIIGDTGYLLNLISIQRTGKAAGG